VPSSDADLLVILSASDRRPIDRIPLYVPQDTDVPVDVIPITRREMEERLARGDAFLRGASSEAITLFSRS
jgi:hypothetical protein